MDWGIDYPGEEDEEIVLYVWVDAPIEYISSTKQYTERVGAEEYDWEEVWRATARLSTSSAATSSSTTRSSGPRCSRAQTTTRPWRRRDRFHHDQRKGLSTSRNRAIWAKEYLEEDSIPTSCGTI